MACKYEVKVYIIHSVVGKTDDHAKSIQTQQITASSHLDNWLNASAWTWPAAVKN